MGIANVDADVVVLQRPGRSHWTYVIKYLQEQGVRVVVDVDDDLTAIPKQNVAFGAYSPDGSPYHSRDWVMAACDRADLVTVSTPALAKVYGRHGRVKVLPNYVPQNYLDVRVDREFLVAGWTGSVETHPHDLEVTGGGIHRALMMVGGSSFGVIGTGVGVEQRLGCKVDRVSGWLKFECYAHAVAALDVGIVPLHPSRFNDGKSCLKGMEYAALGVAPVMSPTPDNLRLHELGVGLIAETPKHWKTHVARLLGDGNYRADIVESGREVMAGLTYEKNAEQWLDAWTSTLDRELVSN